MFTPYDWRSTILLFALAAAHAAGCGGASYTPAVNSDPPLARQALAHALDSWKSGTPPDALSRGVPPLYARDEDWSAARTLAGYSILDDGEVFGNGIRFLVELELGRGTGRSSRTRVRYVVNTDPVLSVTRDDNDV